ncbi:MAG TPA: hypothetical protein VFY06_06105 [Verrucomicrobiae bacterium]|nr:hypothetical protein [Verrucomicrobiae bacterium]
MSALEPPVYVSRRTPAGLWQQYRIFSDRLELQSWFLFHTIVIPAQEIVAMDIRPSVFSGRKGFTWGIKLDNSDLCRHVLVTRRNGWLKRIAFTPDNPEEFVRIGRTLMTGRQGDEIARQAGTDTRFW